MSLENLKLPDFILAELFKDSLVESENVQEKKEVIETKLSTVEPKPLPERNEKPLLKFLGENKKNIVVIVSEPRALFINDGELDFLTKILTACNLNIADIAIVNLHTPPVTFSELKDQFKAQCILLFGIEPVTIKVPFSVPQFQVQPFAETTIFHTPPLAAMLPNTQESKVLKSKLWVSLKTAFKL